MKTWIKRTLIGLFGATALFGALAAWGHHHHRHGWQAMSEADSAQMKAKVVDKVSSRLSLDAEQKAKLSVLADKLQEQRKAFIGSTTDPHAELQSLMAGATFDRAKASTLIDAKVAAVTTQSPAVVAALGDFYDSLKPEQQAKVREFMAKRGGHRG